MQTPTKPQLTTCVKTTIRTERKDRYDRTFRTDKLETDTKSGRADRSERAIDQTERKDRYDRTTAKTPFQMNNNYLRDFRSELQPNRFSRARLQQPQTGSKYENYLSKLACIKSQMSTNQIYSKSTAKDPDYEKPAPQMPRAQSESSIKYQVRVNDKTYKVLRKIGSGGSAKVYEGFEPTTYQPVAIKIINVAKADPRAREGYFNEKSLLMKLQDCDHVVRMFDSEYKEHCKELVIVMEKGDVDLSQVIEQHFKTRGLTIDGIFIKFYWRGMLLAVNDIHMRGIVHADLKPVNFILVKNEIKLIDFGIASAIDPEGTSVIRDYQIGTVNYMAPEALRNRAMDASFIQSQTNDENDQKRLVIKYNSKVDIWSLGCILYNLVYGKPPFDEFKDLVTKLHAITDPRHNIKFPEISNPHLLRCMKACLRYNPKERPSARQLLDDPYLKGEVLTIEK